MDVSRRAFLILVFAFITVVGAACGGGNDDSPIGVVERALNALYDGDMIDFGETICSQRADLLTRIQGGNDLAEFIRADLGDVSYEVTAETSTAATVLVSGTIVLEANGVTNTRLAADVLGNGFEIEDGVTGTEVSLIRENDAWKICDDILFPAVPS